MTTYYYLVIHFWPLHISGDNAYMFMGIIISLETAINRKLRKQK